MNPLVKIKFSVKCGFQFTVANEETTAPLDTTKFKEFQFDPDSVKQIILYWDYHTIREASLYGLQLFDDWNNCILKLGETTNLKKHSQVLKAGERIVGFASKESSPFQKDFQFILGRET